MLRMKTVMHIFSEYRKPVLFTLAFLFAILPVLIRWYMFNIPGIIGFPQYYHQRIALDIIQGEFNWYDNLSFGGRPYTYPPGFVFTLAGFALLFGPEWGGVIFLGILGGFAGILIWELSKLLGINQRVSFVLCVLSPLFLYLFSNLSTRSPPIILGLAGIYLILRKKPWYFFSPFFALTFLYHWETGLVFLILAAFLLRDKKEALAVTLFSAFGFSALIYLPVLANLGIPVYTELHKDYLTRGYGLEYLDIGKHVWEFSSPLDSLYIPVFLLTLSGFFLTKNSFLRFWFIFAFVLSLISGRFFIYLFPVFALLSSSALESIRSKFKQILLIGMVVYLIIFIPGTVSTYASWWPTKEQTDAFLWIKKNTPENSTILTDWTLGHWVTGIAQRKNFMDGYAEYAPEVDKRFEQLLEFYKTCKVPEGYGIDYILMEKWFIESRNITCIYRFPVLYNNSDILIFGTEPSFNSSLSQESHSS